jgi:CRP/FNR family transcriptional regulator, cyclic AMP receptor protein
MTVQNNRGRHTRKLLATIGKGAKVVAFRKKQAIFTQGNVADAVFYIQTGKVKLTVISKFRKEATLGILIARDFFGDGALSGQPLRLGSATALSDCKLLRIDKKAMRLALRRERTFSDLYIAYLLARNIQYHEALIDQLFDSSEKRLARVLLLLARFGEEGAPRTVLPKVSRDVLAAMACTTLARVSFSLNSFKESGYVADSKSGLQIHGSLLNVVLQD